MTSVSHTETPDSPINASYRDIPSIDASSTDAYRLAEIFSVSTNKCIFITGKAGTGKTTFLKKLREQSRKNMAVVAPTGIAAINAGGVTIHSFFQLPIRTLVPTPQSYRQIFAEQRMYAEKRNILYHLELLVIDEISMVRADVLDAIDAILRHYKYRPNQPFGGAQVIFIGDLFQLSPVVRGDDEIALSTYYEGPYFFQSRVMQQLRPVYIELDHVFRQQDSHFVNLLNEIRSNRLSPSNRELLNSRYLPSYQNTEDDFHITLTTHKHVADSINCRELERLPGRMKTFKAFINGTFPETSYPTDEILSLKIGARVIFIRNDDQKPRRFHNGKQGIVKAFTESGITIACENEDDILVKPIVWENIRYREDPLTGNITEEVLGEFIQYPVRTAWAITIHKSQGLTFDKVIIDAAHAFAAGQVYVALSRCRTLEGIVLSTPVGTAGMQNDRHVLAYTESQSSIREVKESLETAQLEYRLQLFNDLFDFRRPVNLIAQLRQQATETVSFNTATLPFLTAMQQALDRLVPIGEQFQKQLFQILASSTYDNHYISQRLQAADNYFAPHLQDICRQLDNMPCRCRNKTDAADFLRVTADLFLTLHQKLHIMQALALQPTTEQYLAAKTAFVSPSFSLTSILDKKTKSGNKKKKRTEKGTDKTPKCPS